MPDPGPRTLIVDPDAVAVEDERAGVGGHLRRIALLAVTGISLYLVAPGVIEMFATFDQLRAVSPAAVVLVVVLEAGSLACTWLLQRVALQRPPWGSVVLSQLAGNAVARVVPGGGAAGAAAQFKMLRKAGIDGAIAASALTAVNVLTFATLLALPLLVIPVLVFGAPIPEDLLEGLWIALASLAVLFVIGASLLVADGPLSAVGRGIESLRNRLVPKRDPLAGLAATLVVQRDQILRVLGGSWWQALVGTIGRWLLDCAALLVALKAVGADPRPSLVLLAFVTAQVLAQIPITPGGLGFVEAGMTAMLALAGVDPGDAVLATLLYRLASYWLPLPAGAVAWAIHARIHRSSAAAQRSAP